MTFDELLHIHTACVRAWHAYESRPGSFDVAFSECKAAIAEAKAQPTLAADPRCKAMFESFEKIQAVVREKRRLRDIEQRRHDRRTLQRYIRETGDIRIFPGGDCSGNAR